MALGGLYPLLEVGSSCLVLDRPLSICHGCIEMVLQVPRTEVFKESNLAPAKVEIVNQKLCTVLGIGKIISLPEQTSSIFRHLVFNCSHFFHDKIQTVTSREKKKKSQIILITGSRIHLGQQLLFSIVLGIKKAFCKGLS